MRKSEIESWVLTIVDRIVKSQPLEDSRIELKSEWPSDPFKAARQIAAHANSARGESILWIIGLDEKDGMIGAKQEEFSNWWAKVTSWFDEKITPRLIDLNIPYNEKTLVALLLETDRAPFVIKNRSGKLPHREVPWREGTKTRTAHRSDLLKILAPISKLPKFEVLESKVELREDLNKDERLQIHFLMNLKIYVTTWTEELIVIPFHKCNAEIKWEGQQRPPKLNKIKLKQPFKQTIRLPGSLAFAPPESDSLTIGSTSNEVLISGSGMINLEAELSIPKTPEPVPKSLKLLVSFELLKTDRITTIEYDVKRREYNSGKPLIALWR